MWIKLVKLGFEAVNGTTVKNIIKANGTKFKAMTAAKKMYSNVGSKVIGEKTIPYGNDKLIAICIFSYMKD